MTFALYADEQMRLRAGEARDGGRHLGVHFDLSAQTAYRDFVFYFGSPDAAIKLQTAANAGVDSITITPQDALPKRAGNTAYGVGDVVEPAAGGGLLYQCTTAGVSAAAAPSWLKTVGSNTADGGVVWRCLGRRYRPQDIRLALSASDLDAASGGAALALGHTLNGGAAVAVHLRLSRAVSDKYSLLTLAQLQLMLNDCVETAR